MRHFTTLISHLFHSLSFISNMRSSITCLYISSLQLRRFWITQFVKWQTTKVGDFPLVTAARSPIGRLSLCRTNSCNCVHALRQYIAHLRQQCHNSKLVIFQEKCLKVLKCYTFLWVQRRHNCCPVANFANCVDTMSVKSASANVSFYTNNSKMPNFELWHSCRKWAICIPLFPLHRKLKVIKRTL